MFNTASDVAVTLVYDRLNQLLQWRLDSLSGTVASGTVGLRVLISQAGKELSVVAGDFTGDGFDEIAVFFADVRWNAIVGTAVDPQNPAKGLKFGPALNPSIFEPRPIKIVKATVLGQPRVYTTVTSTCPGTGSGNIPVDYWTIDPQSLALTIGDFFVAQLPAEDNACVHFVDMTTGRFTTALHDQLLVAYGVEGGNVKVLPFDINAQGIAVQQPVFDTGVTVGGGQFSIRSGRFNWSSPVEQAALLISNDFNAPGINTVRILSLDQNFNTTAGPELQAGATSGECVNDMVVGNFDHQQANPGTPPPTTIVNPDLQVAIPFSNCDNPPDTPAVNIRIFDVDPANQFQIAKHSEFVIGPGRSVFRSTLATVDLQGRSARLGTPATAVLEKHAQPVVITGAPPMHVDYMTPIGKSAPQILNVSAIPDGFLAKYSLTDSTSEQSSSQHTTSWQTNFQFNFSLGAYAGNCTAGPCVDFNTTFGTNDTWAGSVKDQYSTGSAETFNAAFSSQFGDYVRYDDTRITLYLYPVLGKTVCPDPADLNCAESDRVPMFIQFSAPDQAHHENVLGPSLEWYQPPWEPGNIFSYPGNEAQLKVYQSSLDKLSGTENETFHTDKTPGTESTTWSANAGTSQTTGTSTNFNGSFSTSLRYKAVAFQGGFNLSVSGGQGQEQLDISQTTLGTSAGVEITKPGTFLDPPNYQYAYTPIIYGHDKPAGKGSLQPLQAEIQTFGFLGTNYIVDPVTPRTGFWLDNYASHPDVALNHPIRWSVTSTTSNPGDGTCLPYNTQTPRWDCVALGTKLSPTVRLWDDEFHSLRGFFITSADTPEEGSLLQAVDAGDKVTLGTRVYNYSLKDMDSGATIHVRFYGQQVDPSSYNTIGDSFLIGEKTLEGASLPPEFNGPICPFNVDTACPNWTIAWLDEPFDTTLYSNQTLIFWVIVWMEDAQGQLVQELDNHGLTGLPPASLTSFMDAVNLEDSYSNNVGYFKFPFYVLPKTETPGPVGTPMTIEMSDVRTSGRSIAPGAPLYVETRLRAGAAPFSGSVSVNFYDGDPEKGGTLFDVEQVGYVKAQSEHLVRVPFRSSVCGEHRLYVTAGKKTPFEQTDRSQPIEVEGRNCVANGPPDCSAATASVNFPRLGNRHRYPVTISGVTAPPGDTVNMTITSIFQDEPVVNPTGKTCPDSIGVDAAVAKVRNERLLAGDGRVYHIGFTATDSEGASCTGEVKACVPAKEGETCGDQGALFDSTACPE